MRGWRSWDGNTQYVPCCFSVICHDGTDELTCSPVDAWVVGDVFLSTVYVEFSFSDNTVGFSRQA